MTKNYRDTIIWQAYEAAFDAIIAKELNEQYEREQQGLMHQLDQDDQAIEDFCNAD